MALFSFPLNRRRRWLRVGLLVLLVLLGVGAAWGWSAHHLSLARSEAGAHQPRKAWGHLDKARMTWPFRVEAHLLAARTAPRLGDIARARFHLEAHAKRGGDSRDRALEETLLLVQEGNLAEREK